MENTKTVETTLGDLIVALTEEARPFVQTEKQAYHVAAFMLTHLLFNSGDLSHGREYWH